MEDNKDYISGDRLLGDDYTLEQIAKWYEDETHGYSDLGANDRTSYKYVYHALNVRHGFRHLTQDGFENVLGLGSAYGDEFLPIIKKIGKITILEPSDAFVSNEVHGLPCTFLKPSIDGRIPFGNDSFDLITCIGALHHIPNVTFVISELYRCLSGGGSVLIRDPIITMGDWSKPRAGMTARERGIPLRIFHKIIEDAGFRIRHETLCMFPGVQRFSRIGIMPYNNWLLTWLDAGICRLLKWNVRYHATALVHKFRPGSVYYVLEKNIV